MSLCRTHVVIALVVLYLGMAHCWDIAVSLGDRLEFYTNGTKTDIAHFESHNLTAITYDEVHNTILFVDKQNDNDAICGYNLVSTDVKCFIKRYDGNIQDLAFDPAKELLFFTDNKEGSINWISLKDQGSEDNVYGNLLIKLDDRTVKNIAVDSCRGYIYWTNTYEYPYEHMERARFDGSEREVIYEYLPVYSFAIDPQTQTNYYIDGMESAATEFLRKVDIRKKYLNAQEAEITYIYRDHSLAPKELTVSNNYIYWLNIVKDNVSYTTIWQRPKSAKQNVEPREICKFYSERPIGITANYRIREQVQGLQDCEALSSLIPRMSVTNNIEHAKHTQHITKTYQTTEAEQTTEVKLTCVHGLPVCKCIPGYTGERCNVSVCENYCLQGYCSINNEGIPECRCNVGYFGQRCELNTCNGYCLNDGDCSLNEKSEQVCQCKGNYVGDRCEASRCLNYCFQGNCSFNDEGHPQCRCNPGYSGERCEISVCHGYCLNNGECMLNEEDEPVCECVGNHEGSRCESIKNDLPVMCSENI